MWVEGRVRFPCTKALMRLCTILTMNLLLRILLRELYYFRKKNVDPRLYRYLCTDLQPGL